MVFEVCGLPQKSSRDRRKLSAMSTATKITKTVEAALAEWERLKVRSQRIEADRQAELLAEQKKLQKACEPINEAAQEKLAPLQKKMKALEATIEAELKAGISPDGNTVAVAQVDVGGAVAEVKDSGKRYIEPQEFLKAVAPADRTSEFYGCLEVYVTKAAKFLPELVMNKLTKLNHKHAVVIRLKQ